jgi:hypothetical protein
MKAISRSLALRGPAGLILFLGALIVTGPMGSSADISKDLAALKKEVRTAQAGLEKAKPGPVLTTVIPPASVKTMQKLLEALRQKAGSNPGPSKSIAALSSSLQALDAANKKKDRTGVRRILDEVQKEIGEVEGEGQSVTIPGIGVEYELPSQQAPRAATAAAVRGSLTIASFSKYVEPGTARQASTPPSGSRSTTIDIGETVRLRWRIEGCHVADVFARIAPGLAEGRGADTVEPGRRIDDGNGCFHMANEIAVSPRDTTSYTLSAAGMPAGSAAAASKTYTVNVRRPRIVVGYPEVNVRDYRVRFSAINRGELDLVSTPLTVHFRVIGTLRDSEEGRQLQDTVFRTPPMSIQKSQRVDLGEQALLNRPAYDAFSGFRLEVEISAGPVASGWVTFNHGLGPVEEEIGNRRWELFGSAVDGIIRINNYDQSVTSNTVSRRPLRSNDCYVEIGGERRIFGIDPIGFRVSILGVTRHYRFFINNLSADLGGWRFLSMADRKLKMHIDFGTDGGPEIKGWLQSPSDEHVYHDDDGPDIDLTRLDVDLYLTLGLREGRLTYTAVDARPMMDLEIVGQWAWLTSLVRNELVSDLRNAVRGQVSAMMMGEDVRRDFENALAQGVALIGIDRILAIRTETDRIFVTHER